MPAFAEYPDTPKGQKPQLLHLRNFRGMNQRATRAAIGNDQFTWLENLWPIQPGNLQAGLSDGAAVFATAKTIINSYFYTLSGQPLCIVFFSDGTATQFNTVTGVQVNVSNVVNQFFISSYVPVAAQWNASGIIIAAGDIVNGYFAWDGTTLTLPGIAAPAWLTNNTPTTMPLGVRGSQIEIYQNRVWLAVPPIAGVSPASIQNSGPSNGADFASTAAGVTPQQDASLRTQFNAFKQSNGFLYVVGDSNISAISNVQTGGSPAVTTFANQNLNAQEGTVWPNSAQIFDQALIYANFEGVFVLNGGIVQKVSDDVDDLFLNASIAATGTPNAPSAAVAQVFNIKCYFLLLNTLDFKGVRRNVMLTWDGKQWFVTATLNPNTVLIFTQEFNSELFAWGCDGNHMYPLFQVFSISLKKQLQSKLYSGGDNDDGWISYKKQYRFYWHVVDQSGQGIVLNSTMDNECGGTTPLVISSSGLSATFEFTNSSAQVIHFQNGSLQTIVFGATNPCAVINGNDVANYGRLLGWTAEFIGGAYSVVAMAAEYTHDAPFLG